MPSPVSEALQFAEYAAGFRRRRAEEALDPWRRLLLQAQVQAAQEEVQARQRAAQPITLPAIEQRLTPGTGTGMFQEVSPTQTIPPGPGQAPLLAEALRQRQPEFQQSQAVFQQSQALSALVRPLIAGAIQSLTQDPSGATLTPIQRSLLQQAGVLAAPPASLFGKIPPLAATPESLKAVEETGDPALAVPRPKAPKVQKPEKDPRPALVQKAMKETNYLVLSESPALKAVADQRLRAYLDQVAPQYKADWQSRWPLPSDKPTAKPSGPPPGTRIKNIKTGRMGTWDGTKVVPDKEEK